MGGNLCEESSLLLLMTSEDLSRVTWLCCFGHVAASRGVLGGGSHLSYSAWAAKEEIEGT